MWEEGSLILFRPFYFKNNSIPKDKFFLVLKLIDNNTSVIAVLPSSQDKIPTPIDKSSGCIEMANINFNAFVLTPNRIVTNTGFAFRKKTILYGMYLDTWNVEEMKQTYSTGSYELKGKLKKNILKDIINCFKKSAAVKRKFKKYL